MRALSIRQPWAWLIVNGYKDIENRVWSTRYAGSLLIHASKGMTRAEYDEVADMLANEQPFMDMGIQLPDPNFIERGGIVGMAHCNGSVDAAASPWFFGPYGFVLSQQRAFPMVPFKGQLGFFDVPDGLLP
jgi:hypothetical protein